MGKPQDLVRPERLGKFKNSPHRESTIRFVALRYRVPPYLSVTNLKYVPSAGEGQLKITVYTGAILLLLYNVQF
jgi:hypothetical protein